MREREPVSRRKFLAGAGTVVAAGALAPLAPGADAATVAASGAGAARAGHAAALRALGRTVLRHPGSRPYPALAAGTDTMPAIKHVVVLALENHSFDNFFGMLGRGDGFRLGADGQPTATNPLPPLAAPGDTAAALACSTSGPGTIPPPGSISG